MLPLPDDSRNELAKSICEHLRWTTTMGGCRAGACLGMLETLERHGILTLPPVRKNGIRSGPRQRRRIGPGQ